MADIWSTSDLHAFHDKIVDYCDRPINLKTNNEWILDTINSIVKPGDTVYHLGDLVGNRNGYKFPQLLELVSQFNGNWKMLKGNHDNEEQLKAICKTAGYEYIGKYHEEVIHNKLFVMFHFPIENWHKKHYNSLHLHGHLHKTSSNKIKNRYNVCIAKEHKIYNIEEFIS